MESLTGSDLSPNRHQYPGLPPRHAKFLRLEDALHTVYKYTDMQLVRRTDDCVRTRSYGSDRDRRQLRMDATFITYPPIFRANSEVALLNLKLLPNTFDFQATFQAMPLLATGRVTPDLQAYAMFLMQHQVTNTMFFSLFRCIGHVPSPKYVSWHS